MLVDYQVFCITITRGAGKWPELVAVVRSPGVLSRNIVDTESHDFMDM